MAFLIFLFISIPPSPGNKPETKIWTAEDPVEITQRGLRQVQVKPKIGFDFAAAMRAFLRADPDVIMVGEMRDKETTQIGIEASLTGHLVFSTLHTNSAPESVTRLLDMGMDPFLILQMRYWAFSPSGWCEPCARTARKPIIRAGTNMRRWCANTGERRYLKKI